MGRDQGDVPLKVALVVVLVGLAVASRGAAAQPGLNFSWNGCGAAGVPALCFACDRNDGFVEAVGSFVAPAGISQLTGNEIVIDIQTSTSPLPDWWQLHNSGSCRSSAISMDLGIPSDTATTCLDPFFGGVRLGEIVAYRTFTTLNPTPAPNRARIVMVVAVAPQDAQPLDEGVEYHSFRVRLGLTRSAGPDLCSGCATPAWLVLNSINLTQPVGVGDFLVTNAASRRDVYWQDWPYGASCTVPTQNRTWGAIKSLYR